jgi:hypothetical protein
MSLIHTSNFVSDFPSSSDASISTSGASNFWSFEAKRATVIGSKKAQINARPIPHSAPKISQNMSTVITAFQISPNRSSNCHIFPYL